MAGEAGDFDGAVMILDDTVDDGESHARAAAWGLGSKERFEDPALCGRVHAMPGIGDREAGVESGFEAGVELSLGGVEDDRADFKG